MLIKLIDAIQSEYSDEKDERTQPHPTNITVSKLSSHLLVNPELK